MLTRLFALVFNRLSVPWQRRLLALGVPRFFVGVVALCVDEAGGVLLARHRVGDPRWRLPGGWLERQESIGDCIRRELREELGCEAEVLGVSEVTAGYKYPRVEVVLRCRLLSEPRAASGEIVEVRYFARDELPPLRADQRELIDRAFQARPGDLAPG